MPGHLRRRSLSLSLTLTLTIGLVAGLQPQPASAAPPPIVETIVESALQFPWDVAFLPDGRMLVTERPGRVRIYDSGIPDSALVGTVNIPDVRAQGEAGLMGIAVDVDFASNRYVYVCASRDYPGSGGWKNEVIRYTLAANGNWVDAAVLVGGMAANTIHNGCALEMDRFGMLWVTMGDAGNEALAQNRGQPERQGPAHRPRRRHPRRQPGDRRDAQRRVLDGPSQPAGHRLPAGHRPGLRRSSTARIVNDEINLLVAGGNYGWPCYTGAGDAVSTPSRLLRPPRAITTALVIGRLDDRHIGQRPSQRPTVGGLQRAPLGQHAEGGDVRRFALDAPGTTLSGPDTHFNGLWGRLRAAASGPGGQLYLTTSNGSNSDQVIRISPATPTVERLWGADRFATAAAVSQAAYPGGATNVMVATGRNFPDALAGSAAAGNLAMPVLLVETDSIPASTLSEIDRLNPQKIYVLGGAAVVSDAVRTQLQPYAATGEVERLFGADRYATAAAISAEFYAPNVPAAFIAVGTGFADALAGGAGGGAQRLAVAARADRCDPGCHVGRAVRASSRSGSTSWAAPPSSATRLPPSSTRTPPAPCSAVGSGPVRHGRGRRPHLLVAAHGVTWRPGRTSPTRWRAVPWRAGTGLPFCSSRDRHSRSRPGRRSCAWSPLA